MVGGATSEFVPIWPNTSAAASPTRNAEPSANSTTGTETERGGTVAGGSGSGSSWAITGAIAVTLLISRINTDPIATTARMQASATSHSNSELTWRRVASIGLGLGM